VYKYTQHQDKSCFLLTSRCNPFRLAWEVSHEWYEALFCFIYTYINTFEIIPTWNTIHHTSQAASISRTVLLIQISRNTVAEVFRFVNYYDLSRYTEYSTYIYIYIIEGIYSIHELLTTPLVGCTSKLFQSIFRSTWQVSSPYVFWNCYVSCWRHGPIHGIRFLKMGVPKMDGLKGKLTLKWMILRYPHFRKPPFELVKGRSLNQQNYREVNIWESD